MPFRRFFPIIIAVLVIFLGVLNMLALNLGLQRPMQSALTGFTVGCIDRIQPCWYGIVPGQTTLEDAHQLIQWNQKASDTSASESRFYLDFPDTPEICRVVVDSLGQLIVWLKIEYCGDSPVQIGDVTALLGMPARMLGADREMGYGGTQTNRFGWWSPFDHASAIDLVFMSSDPKPAPWRGFIPRWRYCQIEADTAGC